MSFVSFWLTAAKTAAPSSPVSAFRITFTGIAASSASNGAFSRNARMKRPSVSAGRIFGAMPPPTNSAAGRHDAQREVAGFRAVGLDEHLERFDTASQRRSSAAAAIAAGASRLSRSSTPRHAPACVTSMNVAEPRTGHDVLDLRAPEPRDQPAEQADLALVPGGEVGVPAFGRRRDEAAVDVVQQRFAQSRAGRDQPDVAVRPRFALLQHVEFGLLQHRHAVRHRLEIVQQIDAREAEPIGDRRARPRATARW